MTRRQSHQTTQLTPTPAKEDDIFYVTWGRETLKNNISFVNDVLRQFLTINAALLGGGVIFLDDKVINTAFKVPIILMLLFSLITSLTGIMPFGLFIDLHVADDIRKHKKFVFTTKLIILAVTALLFIASSVIILIGISKH